MQFFFCSKRLNDLSKATYLICDGTGIKNNNKRLCIVPNCKHKQKREEELNLVPCAHLSASVLTSLLVRHPASLVSSLPPALTPIPPPARYSFSPITISNSIRLIRTHIHNAMITLNKINNNSLILSNTQSVFRFSQGSPF